MATGVDDPRTRMDPALQAVADAVTAAGAVAMVELAPPDARERVRASVATCTPGPDVAAITECDVDEHVSVRIYRPTEHQTDTTIVHFHGGGWVTGDLDYADAFCRTVATAAATPVVSVDYRLAPEHRFPAAVDDAAEVVRWVAAGGAGLGPRTVVTGDSAGGNLAAVCAGIFRDDDTVDVVGQVLVYPVLDTDPTRASYVTESGVFLGADEMRWFLDHYCPDHTDRTSPLIAPLRAADLSGLPPAVVAVAGCDPLRDEGLEYAARLAAAGVDVELLQHPSLPHGFLQFTAVAPAAAAAAAGIAAAVDRIVARIGRCDAPSTRR